MRRSVGIALAIGLLLGSGIGYAAAQCTSDHCLYIPNVHAIGDRCADTNQRLQGGSFSNWLTEYTISPGEPLAVCLMPSLGGPTVQYYAIAHQRSGDIQSDAVPHDGSTPPLIRLTVPTDQLTPGELIEIDVMISQSSAPVMRVGQLYCFVRTP